VNDEKHARRKTATTEWSHVMGFFEFVLIGLLLGILGYLSRIYIELKQLNASK
jgi:hypothetical protein